MPLRRDQAVELADILADDLASNVGGQTAELALNVFLRIREDTIGMRIIGSPHDVLDADFVEQPGADAVVLECSPALTMPVITGFHLEMRDEVAETVFILVIHAIEHIGQPPD